MTLVFADSHAHLHPCFDTADALRCASLNIAAQARRRANGQSHQAVLCLMDTSSYPAFSLLADRCARGEALRGAHTFWTFSPTCEDESLYLVNERLGRLTLIAGRQVVTAENIEILALGTTASVPDGLPAAETLTRIGHAGALALLPWGFAKWTGARGRLVEGLVSSTLGRHVFLGDNGNRLRLWRTPKLLADAHRRAAVVLPGSDPLPLAHEERRLGSYGFVLDGALDVGEPARDLVERLRALDGPVQEFGNRESTFRFVRNQLLLQLMKRRQARV